jgi:hypothetical protein
MQPLDAFRLFKGVLSLSLINAISLIWRVSHNESIVLR